MSYIEKIERHLEQTQDLWIRAIGLFTFILVALYIPGKLIDQAKQKEREKASLIAQVEELQNKIGFYQLNYDQQQKLMGEVDCLARNIYFEAGSEPFAGKVAVAQVTMNRVKSGDFPRSVCGVVKQKTKGICQFSWVCLGKKSVNSNSTAWKESKTIAENILISRKKYSIISTSVVNYHASYVNPSWASTKVFVKQIGQHLFYKT
jgi:spore germination cell wall hydrolase CwlJ-like protein